MFAWTIAGNGVRRCTGVRRSVRSNVALEGDQRVLVAEVATEGASGPCQRRGQRASGFNVSSALHDRTIRGFHSWVLWSVVARHPTDAPFSTLRAHRKRSMMHCQQTDCPRIHQLDKGYCSRSLLSTLLAVVQERPQSVPSTSSVAPAGILQWSSQIPGLECDDYVPRCQLRVRYVGQAGPLCEVARTYGHGYRYEL